MIKLAPWLIVAYLLSVGGAFLGGEWHGRKAEGTKWQARVSTARAEASEAARQAEREQQEAVNAALREQNEELAGINARLAADLEWLRSRPPRAVPEAPRATCQGANGAELSGPDASFLAGLAARADRHRAALAACYAVIDAQKQ